ncbi:hypothetical protein BKA62DRAFT_663026 [Auriculariales sp. MPI-PUGE-AT-0066]|nr:hypothetical protein BKA62DRAFT_663026 [Auriculariales sp. MPI-PUGE-AT-0066]
MGGFDSYCFICGSNARVSASLHQPFQKSGADGIPAEHKLPFFLDDQDDAFAQDLVSIGPYDEQNNPIIDAFAVRPGTAEAARLDAIDSQTIRLVDGLGPGQFHDMGGLGYANDDDAGNFTIHPAVYPFGHALCFRLLGTFAPRLMNPVGTFWAVVRAQNGNKWTASNIEGLNYGDITGSMEQFVAPLHNYEYGPDGYEPWTLPPKLDTALRKDTVDPDVISDYWLGAGKIYVFKRPDLFPVAEAYQDNEKLYTRDAGALATSQPGPALPDLPLELLLAIARPLLIQDALKLLRLNYALRAKLLPHIDALAKQQLEPWAFAADFEKAAQWDALCADNAVRNDAKFPWFAYARACQRSPSMQNRRRIYGICLQLETMAKNHSII